MVPQATTHVRKSTEDDLAALVGLCAELGYPSDKQVIANRLQTVLSDQSTVLLVATGDDGVAIGFVHVGIRPLMVADRTAEICGLIVSESARGKGLGKNLMAAAEQWAQANGCTEVSLRSNVIRKEAHEFYRGLGYELYKTSVAFRKAIGPDKNG